MWYPIEDTYSALTAHRRGELTLRGWLGSILHRQTFPLLSREDPMPSVASTAWLMSRQLSKRLGRHGGLAADPMGSTGPEVATPPAGGVALEDPVAEHAREHPGSA